MKICSTCKKELSLDQFRNRKDIKSGKSAMCKKCEIIQRNKYKEKYPEKYKEIQKKASDKYRKKNRDKLVLKSREYRKNNIEKCRKSSREWNKKNYERYRFTTERWRKNNRIRRNETHNKWWKSQPKKYRKSVYRRDNRNKVDNLTDRYIKDRISISLNIERKYITNDMIELKRRIILARRLIRKKRQKISNQGG